MSRRFAISEDQIRPAIGVDASPRGARCRWLEEAARQFDAIANLPQGWDSHGSPPPDLRQVDAAWAFLCRLCQAADLPKPHINPTPNGGVQFDWEQGPRYFEIDMSGDDQATYLWCDDAARIEQTGTIPEREPLDAVVEFVRRVTEA